MNPKSQLKSSNNVVLGDEMTTQETAGNLLGQSRMRYWGKFTFRVRTAVILTLFILLTALAVGFAFRNVVSILLDNQTNLDLRDDAQEFVEQLESIPGPISLSELKRGIDTLPLMSCITGFFESLTKTKTLSGRPLACRKQCFQVI